MKKIFLLLLFIPVLFVSCGSSDDDDPIEFYSAKDSTKRINELQISSTFIGLSVEYAYVKGGNGTYTLGSSNQDVLAHSNISIHAPGQENTDSKIKGSLYLMVRAVGETTITVTDSDGNVGKLKVTVSETVE